MKSLFTLFCLIAVSGTVSAQDMIVNLDNEQTKVVIVNVTRRMVEYKEWNDTTGTVYVKPTAEVLLIRYQNGKQKFISPGIRKNSSKNTLQDKPNGPYMKYQGDAAIGYSYFKNQFPNTSLNKNVQIETVHGIRISPSIFTGLGIGSILHIPDNSDQALISFYANVRYYFHRRNNLSFFISSDAGCIKNMYAAYPRTRFYFTCGPGITVGGGLIPVSFSIRYQSANQWIRAIQFRIGIGF